MKVLYLDLVLWLVNWLLGRAVRKYERRVCRLGKLNRRRTNRVQEIESIQDPYGDFSPYESGLYDWNAEVSADSFNYAEMLLEQEIDQIVALANRLTTFVVQELYKECA